MSGDNENKVFRNFDMVIGAILGIGLFIAYRVGFTVGENWSYVLLLALSILVYIILSEGDSIFIKFAVMVNILYSVFMLVQHKLKLDWLYNLEENEQEVIGVLLFVFILIGNLMGMASGIFVLAFGIIVGVSWRFILYAVIYGVPQILRSVFLSKVRRSIPDVQGIVRGDRRVYIHKDYHKAQIQLIYRKGARKRILDTYQWKDCAATQYSLEWDGKNRVTVRKYNTMTSRQLEEREYVL